MSYIFLDESGDLGFNFEKPKTSKNFIISLMVVNEKGPIEKIVKKIFKGFSKKEIKFHHGILHCHKEKSGTRIKALEELSIKDVVIITMCLRKKKVITKVRNDKHKLYSYITNMLMDTVMKNKIISANSSIIFVASKRETNKYLNDKFKNYLQEQLINNHNRKLRIDIKSPHEEKCLQVIDFVTWSVFRKYEHGDNTYFNIIKGKTKEDRLLLSK